MVQQELLLSNNDSAKDLHKSDIEFHGIIFRGNNKEDVWGSITQLSAHYNRMKLLTKMEYGFKDAFIQHKKIVSIIENKEINEIESIISQHIMEPTKLWKDLNNSSRVNINRKAELHSNTEIHVISDITVHPIMIVKIILN